MNQRQPHTTKSGPGRRHKDGTFRNGKKKSNLFGESLTAHFTRKNLGAIEAKKAKNENL